MKELECALSGDYAYSMHTEGCFQYLFSFVCLVLVTAEFLSPFLNQILLFRGVFFVLYIIGTNLLSDVHLANILSHLVSGLIRNSAEAQSFHWVPFIDLGFISCMTRVLSGKFPSMPLSWSSFPIFAFNSFKVSGFMFRS